MARFALSPNGGAVAYLLSVPRDLHKDDDGSSYTQLHMVDLKGVGSGTVDTRVVGASHVCANPSQGPSSAAGMTAMPSLRR